jgi:hypothetical protein
MRIFDELELNYGVDRDGDLFLPYEGLNIFWVFMGEQREIVVARGALTQRPDVASRPRLTASLVDWNRTKLFPKAYTALADTGQLVVQADFAHDFEVGASVEQIIFMVWTWIGAIVEFSEWFTQNVVEGA